MSVGATVHYAIVTIGGLFLLSQIMHLLMTIARAFSIEMPRARRAVLRVALAQLAGYAVTIYAISWLSHELNFW